MSTVSSRPRCSGRALSRPSALSRPVLCSSLLALTLVAVSAPAWGQIPEKLTNLQVLPKDSARPQVVATMRAITSGLGVRCTYCHVGPDNLQGMDFATDDKPEKRVAREMLRMVASIRKDFLATLPAHAGTRQEGAARQEVGCYTCHRGQSKPPEQLSVLLSRLAREQGAPAAVARYGELKQQHGADGAYDFREQTLSRVASDLAEAGKPDDALAVVAAAIELFPTSASVRITQAHLLLGKGDKAGAIASFKKALELDPANEHAKGMVAELEAPAEP